MVETRITDRRHDEQTSDVANILWAIGRGGIHGVDRIAINVASPVDVVVTDSLGNSISRTSRDIPLATYDEVRDETGHIIDLVTIPLAEKGQYHIQVLPEAGALPSDTFSITVQRNSATFTLAENVQVQDIPAEGYTVEIADNVEAAIDIKPGDNPNTVNPRSQGKIPVAILSSGNFDAPGSVDTNSLTFGRTGYEVSLAFCNSGGEDVNGDGLADLVCHFTTELTGFQRGDVAGVLRGQTSDGTLLFGTNSIQVVR